jgi:hypothetical protein
VAHSTAEGLRTQQQSRVVIHCITPLVAAPIHVKTPEPCVMGALLNQQKCQKHCEFPFDPYLRRMACMSLSARWLARGALPCPAFCPLPPRSLHHTRTSVTVHNVAPGMPPIRPSPLRLYRSILVAHRRVLPPAVRSWPHMSRAVRGRRNQGLAPRHTHPTTQRRSHPVRGHGGRYR